MQEYNLRFTYFASVPRLLVKYISDVNFLSVVIFWSCPINLGIFVFWLPASSFLSRLVGAVRFAVLVLVFPHSHIYMEANSMSLDNTCSEQCANWSILAKGLSPGSL